MAPRYLNPSALVAVRYLATEAMRRRRPRRASRVRAYVPPLIPTPRRPMDTAPITVLRTLLEGLHRWEVAR